MGRNRSHVKPFNIIALACVLFFSCSKYSSIPNLFDQREYAEIESILAESNKHWEWYLWQNKLKIEGGIGQYTSIDSIFQIMQTDSTFKLREFKRFYYLSKFHSDDFIRELMILEDRFYQPVKSNYYYGELFKMLRSKKISSQQFATSQILNHFDMSYLPFLIPEILNILDDSTQSKTYRRKLRNLASVLELHSDDKRLRVKSDSLYEVINYDITKQSIAIKTPILSETIDLHQFKMIHFHLSPYEILPTLLEKAAKERQLQYYFVLSKRKVEVTDVDYLRRFFSLPSIDDGMMFEFVKQLNVDKVDSVEQLMFDYDSFAIKSFLLNQIYPSESRTRFIPVYFEAFKIGKLQRDIEKRLQYFSKTELSNFVNQKKRKVKEEHLAFLLFWIGITGLTDQSEYVNSFLTHSNQIVKSQAVETSKRLKRE